MVRYGAVKYFPYLEFPVSLGGVRYLKARRVMVR